MYSLCTPYALTIQGQDALIAEVGDEKAELVVEKADHAAGTSASAKDGSEQPIPYGAKVTLKMKVLATEAFGLHPTEKAPKIVEWQGARKSHEWLIQCKPRAPVKKFDVAFRIDVTWTAEGKTCKKELTCRMDVVPLETERSRSITISGMNPAAVVENPLRSSATSGMMKSMSSKQMLTHLALPDPSMKYHFFISVSLSVKSIR
jgi:hypothetical protein